MSAENAGLAFPAPRPVQLTEKQMRGVISELIAEWGSQSNVAGRLGITQQHLSDIRAGKRGVSAEVARKMGYRREVWFTKEKERT